MPATDTRVPSSGLSRTDWSRWVLLGTLALTLLRIVYASQVELAPQEAYYWQYARHLALSYFDHPPMSAWMIALSTRLLGHTELGVRLPAILCSAATVLLLYRLGTRLFDSSTGALAALLASATVLFGLGAVIITPDVPLALLWTAALLVLIELLLDHGRLRSNVFTWCLLGTLVGLALLSKYTAALLLPQILLSALLLPRGRLALKTAAPYLGFGCALVVFSPVIIWNAQHHWDSFLFQSAGRAATVHGVKPFLFGRYLVLQAIGVGPLLYLALWGTAWGLSRKMLARDPRATLLAVASLPGLLLFTAVSPWHWVKLNWVAPAYLSLLVATAAHWTQGWSSPRIRMGVGWVLGTGTLLVVTMYLMPLIPEIPFHERDNLVSGWRELARAVVLEEEALGAQSLSIVGWGYKTASELAFYLPGQPQTLSNSVLDAPGLAYGYWEPARKGIPTSALVVADEREPQRDLVQRLHQHCGRIQQRPDISVHRGPHVVTRFHLWRCDPWRPSLHDGEDTPIGNSTVTTVP